MRKWNKKNKSLFFIFSVLVILIILVFAICIKNILKKGLNQYVVSPKSILYTEETRLLKVNDESLLKRRWNGKYYLTMNNFDYSLGNTSVIFKNDDYRLFVYGDIYQIFKDTTIVKLHGENAIIKNVDSSFYKLEDRKYLVVSSKITDKNKLLSADNYLVVEVDKNGNALLLNDHIHQKTLNPMILITDSYQFDIANEKLKWGNQEINLKKVNGSSNEYKEIKSEKDGESIHDIDSPIKPNNVPNTNINNGNSNSGFNEKPKEEKIIKYLNLKSITPSVTSLNVEYNVFDPRNEYVSVYLLINDGSDEPKKIQINKFDTEYKILGLKPNKEYEVSLNYTLVSEDSTDNELIEMVHDVIRVKTENPKLSLQIVKIKANELIFKFNQDFRYQFDKGVVELYIDDNMVETKTINLEESLSKNGWVSSFKISNIGTIFEIRLNGIEYNGDLVDFDLSSKAVMY